VTRRVTLLMLSKMGAGDGGRETWLANFLDEVARQGRDVVFDVIHQQAEAPTLLDVASRAGVVGRVHQVARRWPWLPVSAEFLLRLAVGPPIRATDAPIIAVGSLAEAMGALWLTASDGKARRFMWLRGIYTREKSAQLPGMTRRLVLALERFVLGRFGTVIANGADTAAFYRTQGIDSHVIANAVPLGKWTMPLPTDAGTLRVAFIGRLTDVKGIGEFLEAAEACEREAPGACSFHVAGDGPARARVEAVAARMPLVVHGQLDNDAVRDLVRACDACVALTVSSPRLGGGGVSNALVEQMAAGRILFAWDNDIFRQVLDASSAYLVPQGDAPALAGAMLRAACARGEALQRADGARRLSRRYSIETHVDAFFGLLGADVQVSP
jgi:glycosyltransferase involved in cell wall biosynthesis